MKLLDLLANLFRSRRDPDYLAPLTRRDFSAAIFPLQVAIRQGDACAMGIYATLLGLGQGIDRDPAEALIWFRQAAVRGHVPSQAALGYGVAAGLGTSPDWNEGGYWLLRAARAGHRKAAIGLSELVLADRSLLDTLQCSNRELYQLMLNAKSR